MFNFFPTKDWKADIIFKSWNKSLHLFFCREHWGPRGGESGMPRCCSLTTSREFFFSESNKKNHPDNKQEGIFFEKKITPWKITMQSTAACLLALVWKFPSCLCLVTSFKDQNYFFTILLYLFLLEPFHNYVPYSSSASEIALHSRVLRMMRLRECGGVEECL